RVYAFVVRRSASRGEAEDLTAEVFHQALAHLGRFEWRGAPFVAWLLQIARNAVADRWQRLARERGEPVPDPVEPGNPAESDPRPALPAGDAELTELLQIARDLRDLPSPAFKARLGADLARRATMTTTTETTTSRDIRSVTPYLAVQPAAELIEFVKRAFGAREILRTTGSSGGLHAEVQIGDTRVMIGGGSAW